MTARRLQTLFAHLLSASNGQSAQLDLDRSVWRRRLRHLQDKLIQQSFPNRRGTLDAENAKAVRSGRSEPVSAHRESNRGVPSLDQQAEAESARIRASGSAKRL